MATLILTGSVGSGRKKGKVPHNEPADVRSVRDRLVALGFTWVKTATRGDERDFTRAIRLFQCICEGKHKLNWGDGRVGLHKTTHRWLAATNAPEWVSIFGSEGFGWKNTSDFVKSNGGFTTSWLRDAINVAGGRYFLNKVVAGFRGKEPFPPMWVMEASPEHGGDASGHGSHETGIDVDMRLPLLPPDSNKWTNLDNKGYNDPRFHRDAAKAQLEAIKSGMKPRFVFFNDPAFRRAGLCQHENNHDQHYHIRIKPPARVDGVYMGVTPPVKKGSP